MAPENLIDFVERIKWWGKHQLLVTFKSLPRRQTQKSPRVLNNLHLLFETVSCKQRPTDKDLPLYRNFEKKILSISQTNTRQSYVKNVLCYNVTPLFGLYCASTFLFSKAANQLKALGKKKKPKGPVMLWVRNSFDTRPIHPRFLLYTLQKIENAVVNHACARQMIVHY